VLEVLDRTSHPVGIVTKSALVVRDADILARMASRGLAKVAISVTTLDRMTARKMEPRAATPPKRIEAIRALAQAGVPVAVMVAPIIPALNDSEIERILEAAREAGARGAAWILLRLPFGVKTLFADWLERHFPERRSKVLNRVQEVRGGRMNDPRFGSRMRGEGVHARQIEAVFDLSCRRLGLARRGPALETGAFRRPGGRQLDLFGA